MSRTATRITADEYYALTVEGDRKQLVAGEIIVNEPKFIHAILQERLLFGLSSWLRAGPGRGVASFPTDVRVDEHNVYGPDVLWFAAGRVPENLDAYPDHLPDLCVEIRSAGTWRYDVGAKKNAYERAGLTELWLVDDASETVLVYRRSAAQGPAFDVAVELGKGEELTSPLLPGFALALDELFER